MGRFEQQHERGSPSQNRKAMNLELSESMYILLLRYRCDTRYDVTNDKACGTVEWGLLAFIVGGWLIANNDQLRRVIGRSGLPHPPIPSGSSGGSHPRVWRFAGSREGGCKRKTKQSEEF
jgi:hypothetical protein